MDVHNVTMLYAGFIEQQKKAVQEAKKRQGHRPRDRKPKEYAYSKFMSALTPVQHRPKLLMIHSSILPPAYLPCTSPMTQLSSITIEELQLETHHRGTYLLLRSITPPSRMTAIMALMEDGNGDALLLQLYQQEDEDIRPADNIVTVGTILLIKEPYFKLMSDGDYGLRVDHLSDVVHLKKDDDRIPKAWLPQMIENESSAESLKMQGNSCMKESKYWDAIKRYSDALDQPATADQVEAIKSNRSLAFLKTNQFDAALTDTNFPNFSSNSSEKGLFRTAEALYNLERFSECCPVLELLCSKFPRNSQASQLLGRAKSRYLEQTTGEYNFGQLQEDAKKLRPPHLDFATYIGPVEIRQTESKGRGLFVTKAVKAGDLLMCEKAFSRAHVNEGADGSDNDKGSSRTSLWINPEKGQVFMGAQPDLNKSIVQKLYRNPSLAPAFTALHRGKYEKAGTSMIDGEPIVDTFLVERIISLNGFGCPVSSLASLAQSHDQHHSPPSPLAPNAKRDEKGYFHSCGIWVQASYINHSCISNARRAFIGNMMIVRASRDMDTDTEITFWYRNPDGASANESDELFKNQWGFTCDCAICVDSRATNITIHHKRQKLLQDLKQVFANAKGSINSPSSSSRQETRQIERLLTALNQTYTQPSLLVPRLLVIVPQISLTRLYSAQNKPEKMLDSAGKVLTLLGFVLNGAAISSSSSSSSSSRFTVTKWGLLIDHAVVETFMHLQFAFAALGAEENARSAQGYARTAYRVLVGEDATFEVQEERGMEGLFRDLFL